MILRWIQPVQTVCSRALATYKFLNVETPFPKVYNVQLNRPDKRNALTIEMWEEIGQCFNELSDDSDCRAIIISGNGKIFCAGIDISAFLQIVPKQSDIAHKALYLMDVLAKFQRAFTTLESCKKPVIAAIHSGCVGGGVDLVTAADIRLISSDSFFQVKEVDIGIAADVGTLQRLPKIIGNQSAVNEMCLTARRVYADEAMKLGLASRMYVDKTSLLDGAFALAKTIASKSPVAVQGTKANLVYSRNHSVEEGLRYVATWNSAMLLGNDPVTAISGGNNFEDPS